VKHSSKSAKKTSDFSFLRGITKSSSLSIIISCLALGVSAFTAIVSYNSAKNIMRPLLHIGVGDSQSHTPCYGLFIRNNGMGPARIKSVEIHFDGEPIRKTGDAPRVISRAGFPGQPLDFEVLTSPIEHGMVIGAGQEVILFAGAKDRISNLEEIKSVLERVRAHIVYSSVGAYDYEANFPVQ
jgi:hypothetical protein